MPLTLKEYITINLELLILIIFISSFPVFFWSLKDPRKKIWKFCSIISFILSGIFLSWLGFTIINFAIGMSNFN